MENTDKSPNTDKSLLRTNETGNPDNSSIIQCLLDLEKAMAVSDNPDAPDILKAVKTIKDNLSESDILHSDKIFNAHRYGDRKLVFSKLSRFRENQIITSLSSGALKILVYGIQIMSEDNCFLVRQAAMIKTLGMSRQTLANSLKELTDKGCMVKICMLKRRNPSGTVYMIRSDIAKIGSNANEPFFKKMTSLEQSAEYNGSKNCRYDVIHSTVLYNGRTISFNYDDIIISEKN